MYKRILVAVDGSANAAHALQHAAALASALSASLRLIHVIDMGLMPYGPEIGIDIDTLLEARYAAAEKVLADARDSVQAEGIAIETRLVDTALPTVHVATTIAEDAVSAKVDLIVLGTHGRRGVERWLLGSVAEGVARRSTVPVLLVPMPSA
jgi:nucleotide-binding universal stress UspA family protein